MSDMEAIVVKYRQSNVTPLPGEDDYDAAERLGLDFVRVNGQLYEIETIETPDPYGFSLVIEPSEEPIVIALWYNGGAGMHEVVGDAIERALGEAA